MKGQKALFSKKSDHWATPRDMYDWYMDCNYFDPCPLNWDGNKETDGLLIDWASHVFVNPPYSDIRSWLEKALSEFDKGNCEEVVFLIPARTDTKWFHDLIYDNPLTDIRFIKGRLKFGDEKNSAPFPSMIVIFNERNKLLSDSVDKNGNLS